MWPGAPRRGYRAGMSTATTEHHDAPGPAASEAPSSHDQLVLAGKIAGGFVAGIIFTGIIGPIVLAIIIGLATGH